MTTTRAPGMRPLKEKFDIPQSGTYYVHYEYDTDNQPCNLSIHAGGDYTDITDQCQRDGRYGRLRIRLLKRLAEAA